MKLYRGEFLSNRKFLPILPIPERSQLVTLILTKDMVGSEYD